MTKNEAMMNVRRARELLQTGRADEGKALLAGVLDACPDDVEALLMLARASYAAQDFERSRELLQRVVALRPDDALHHFELGAANAALGRFEDALAEFEIAGRSRPLQPEILLQKANALEKLGRRYDAAMLHRKLWIRVMAQGRRVASLPPPMQQAVSQGQRLVRDELAALLGGVLDEVRREYPGEDLHRLERFVASTLGDAPPPERDRMQVAAGAHLPGLRSQPFFERERFDWIEAVEAQAERIRDEYLALRDEQSLFRPYVSMDENAPNVAHWQAVNKSSAWNSCHLYNYGSLKEEAAARCPVTMETLAKAPLIRVPHHGPETIFSVLAPGTHIPAHHGLVSGRLLVHLPLIVPENCGALRVGGEERSWEFGKCLIFDDTYAHEAWNRSDETRVVLIFDIWHPEVTAAERAGFGRLLETLHRVDVDSIGRSQFRE